MTISTVSTAPTTTRALVYTNIGGGLGRNDARSELERQLVQQLDYFEGAQL